MGIGWFALGVSGILGVIYLVLLPYQKDYVRPQIDYVKLYEKVAVKELW